MEEIYEISMLLDFYGQMITRRQFEILDLHYNSDYSLGEIAEYLSISRQGVYDNIKRGKAALVEFEQKLGLVRRFSEQAERAREIYKQLGEIDVKKLDEKERTAMLAIEDGIKKIIEMV